MSSDYECTADCTGDYATPISDDDHVCDDSC